MIPSPSLNTLTSLSLDQSNRREQQKTRKGGLTSEVPNHC